MTRHHIEEFISFLTESPSAFHAASNVANKLISAGYTADFDMSPGGHVLLQGGSVVAWFVPDIPNPRFRIIGSHTDSPGLMVKPNPDLVGEGFHQVAVEVYGGPILTSWFDRDIRFAGRVVLADTSERLVDTGPIARVANLAIHLDRNASCESDRQTHTQPILGGETPFTQIVADSAGVGIEQILAHELISADAQRGEVLGDVLAAGRLDNLSSVWASLQAMLLAQQHCRDVLVLAAFNHEEVGSQTSEGAGGPLLERVLGKLAAALGEPLDVCANSLCVSADAAHSVHPNYPGKHDPTHRPHINKGPVLKVNANKRYASDAASSAEWIRLCRRANVPTQIFAGNNSVPCGSTIGPTISTRLGIPTVDVGIPLLSMHSARELAGIKDIEWFVSALEAFLVAH